MTELPDVLPGHAVNGADRPVDPTIVALRSRAAELADAELTRLHGRLPELGDEAISEITQTVHRVVDKLLYGSTTRTTQSTASPCGISYTAALRELFNLELAASGPAIHADDSLTV